MNSAVPTLLLAKQSGLLCTWGSFSAQVLVGACALLFNGGDLFLGAATFSWEPLVAWQHLASVRDLSFSVSCSLSLSVPLFG